MAKKSRAVEAGSIDGLCSASDWWGEDDEMTAWMENNVLEKRLNDILSHGDRIKVTLIDRRWKEHVHLAARRFLFLLTV